MEAGYGIQRLAVLLGVEQIMRRQWKNVAWNLGTKRRVIQPVGRVQFCDSRSEGRELGIGLQAGGLLGEPLAESGNRRQRGEFFDARKIFAEVFHHAFDEEAAERD